MEFGEAAANTLINQYNNMTINNSFIFLVFFFLSFKNYH
jgi:hypothetical protein